MTTFMQELASRLRTRRQELDAAERTLSTLVRDAGKAEVHYSALIDAAGADGHGFHERDEAQRAASDLNAQASRQRDMVRDIAAEVSQLEALVGAPQRLKDAVTALAQRRAETVAAVGAVAKHSERIEKLQAQRDAELSAAAAGRAWQQAVILARIEGQAPPVGERPEHDPAACESAATVIASMIEREAAAREQAEQHRDALRGAEREAEAAALEAQAAVRELEFSEALAPAAASWARFRAAHVAAFGFEPTEPDFSALGRIDSETAEAEARQVLAAEQPGLLRRVVQRAVEAVGA